MLEMYSQPFCYGSRPWIDELCFRATGHMNSLRHIWNLIEIRGDDECWPWLGRRCRDSKRKHQLWHGRISFGSGTKQPFAHRLIWASINGPIPSGIVIRHSCDNPACCNPRHLLSGTQLDNVRDRVERDRGTRNRGSKCPTAKLNELQVAVIKTRLICGARLTDLAREYGVNKSTIYDIKKGRKWSHLPPLSQPGTPLAA
jgi:hypothetical protein